MGLFLIFRLMGWCMLGRIRLFRVHVAIEGLLILAGVLLNCGLLEVKDALLLFCFLFEHTIIK